MTLPREIRAARWASTAAPASAHRALTRASREDRVVTGLRPVGCPWKARTTPIAPKARRSDVTPSARLHPTKQALQMLYCAQMGWPGPSTSLPEDFDTWLVVLVVLSS